MTLADTWGTGEVLLTMMWFFIFFLWIMLMFRVLVDIFRSHDLSGGVKALWVLFIIVVPFLGIFVYLIARGGGMARRDADEMQAANQAARAYIRDAAASSTADELARLAELKDKGAITDAEFAAAKAKLIG